MSTAQHHSTHFSISYPTKQKLQLSSPHEFIMCSIIKGHLHSSEARFTEIREKNLQAIFMLAQCQSSLYRSKFQSYP